MLPEGYQIFLTVYLMALAIKLISLFGAYTDKLTVFKNQLKLYETLELELDFKSNWISQIILFLSLILIEYVIPVFTFILCILFTIDTSIFTSILIILSIIALVWNTLLIVNSNLESNDNGITKKGFSYIGVSYFIYTKLIILFNNKCNWYGRKRKEYKVLKIQKQYLNGNY